MEFIFIVQFTEDSLKDMVGPSNYEKWMYWQNSTAEQTKRYNIKHELENLLHSNPVTEHYLKPL